MASVYSSNTASVCPMLRPRTRPCLSLLSPLRSLQHHNNTCTPLISLHLVSKPPLPRYFSVVPPQRSSQTPDKPTEKENKPKLGVTSLRENIYTLPNVLTVSRILACPVLGWAIVQDDFVMATSLLVYAGLTDLVRTLIPWLLPLLFILVFQFFVNRCICSFGIVGRRVLGEKIQDAICAWDYFGSCSR